MKQENRSRLFNQLLIMKGIEEVYEQLCKSKKSISTEQVEVLLGHMDAYLDEILTIIREEEYDEEYKV